MEAKNLSPIRSEVEEQLRRILADSLFQKSQRLGGFLRLSVESALAGRAHELKESVIGVRVFDRGESYSPLEDPIVRIMAGRLRAKLAEYYQGSGQADPILIELPRGGYAPKFSSRLPAAFALGPTPPSPSRAVGRESEMSQLRDAFAAISGGSGLVVSVSGDAGMGKTTVAEDFLAELESAQTVFAARGRCSERMAETDAFAPVLEALDGLRRAQPEGGTADLLKSTAPSWYGQVAPASANLPAAKPSSHERMRREFVSFLEDLSRLRPVVLFLDDLHWADVSTCELLAYLAARLRRMRVLVVTTYRPGAILTPRHPFLPLKLELEGRGLGREIPLSFLSREDVDRYLAIKFPGHRFPAELAGIFHERTEGNPLFLVDLLRYLADTKVLVETGGSWMLTQSAADLRHVIPVGTHGMIDVKISQLEEEDRRILRCGAVQGMQFDSAVIAQVLALDPAHLEERLRDLEAVHRFVQAREDRDLPGMPVSIRYRFIHVFYQNALYGSLTASRRAADCLAVAKAMSVLAGEASITIAGDLAILFETGRDFSVAAGHYLQAARNASRVFAYPEAVLLCERGLACVAKLDESRERDRQELGFSFTFAVALMSTRGYAAAEVDRTCRRSRELCLKLGDMQRLMPVLWGLHTCEINRGLLVQALGTAQEMRQFAEKVQHRGAIVASLHAHGTTLAFMGLLPDARRDLERIFEIAPVSHYHPAGAPHLLDPHVTSLSMLARLLVMMGYIDLAMERAVESVELANRLAHPHSLAYATFWVGWILEACGEQTAACQQLESAMEMSRRQGLPPLLEWGRVVRGSALARLGRRTEGIDEMRKSLKRQTAMGSQLERAYCLTLLAEALLGDGQHEEALRLCDEALELGQRLEGRCYEPETHRVRGEVILALAGETRRDEIEGEFACALRQAREAESRLLEVRAATSYFRFQTRWGGGQSARLSLEAVTNWFGSEALSPPLTEARRLLAAVS